MRYTGKEGLSDHLASKSCDPHRSICPHLHALLAELTPSSLAVKNSQTELSTSFWFLTSANTIYGDIISDIIQIIRIFEYQNHRFRLAQAKTRTIRVVSIEYIIT